MVKSIPGIAAPQPIDSELIYYVPDNASGITVCNSGLEKLGNYWGAPSMMALKELLLDSNRLFGLVSPFIAEADKPKAQEVSSKVAQISKAILESELAKLAFTSQGYVQYQYQTAGSLIPVSMAIGESSQEINFKKDYQALINAGIPVKEEVSDGFTFYVFNYNDLVKAFLSFANQPPQETIDFSGINFYTASHGKKYGTGNDKQAIIKFFKQEKYDKKPAIFENADFKAAIDKIGYDPSIDVCQSYIDFKTMVSAGFNATAGLGAGEQATEMDKIFDSFPISSITQTFGYKDGLHMKQQWGIKEGVLPEEARIWLAAAFTEKSFKGLEATPASSAVASALNGEVIQKLKSAADKTPTIQQVISTMPYVDLALSIENIGFSIMPPSSGVIWPESLVTVHSNKAKELFALIKEQAAQGFVAGGLPNFKWLEKEVSGQKAEYFNTPFGVGLYLTQAEHFVSVANSEAVLKTGIDVYKGSAGNLKERLKKMGVTRIDKALGETFISIPNLLSMARTVQTSLAMFMPVNVQISKDYDIIANALGEFYISLIISPGYGTVTFAQKPL